MAKSSAVKHATTLPATVLDEPRRRLASAMATRKAALDMLHAAEKIFDGLAEADFRTRGICERCHGRGWVVVWDTMDSMSGCYAEYGSCPNPACNAKSTGPSLVVKHYSKYDGQRGTPHPQMSDTWNKIVGPMEHALSEADRAVKSIERDIQDLGFFRRGDRLVVVRGRKVPIGTVGTVFWTDVNPRHNPNQRPSRLGLDLGVPDPAKPGKNLVAWVDAEKCEKLA